MHSLIKQSECTGLPIINSESCEIVGRVKEFLFVSDSRKFFGIMLDGGHLNKDKIILSKNVIRMGRDAIIVDGENIIEDLKDALGTNQLLYQFKGKEIYTKDGRDLGIVKDIRINQLNGDIECLEISDGVISDLINGRAILPLIGKISFSDDCILIDDEAYQELQTKREDVKRGGVVFEEYV